MGVSQLSIVTILIAKSELEELIARLYEFGEFHPYVSGPLREENIALIKLKSRAFSLYSDLDTLLRSACRHYGGSIAEDPESEDLVSFGNGGKKNLILECENITEVLDKASYYKESVSGKMKAGIKISISDISVLLAAKEAAIVIFDLIKRIRPKHELKNFLIIEGYIPSKSERKFSEDFSSWHYNFSPLKKADVEKGAVLHVPTLLTNPRFVKLFEDISAAQGLPGYREIDPTPIVAFVFPIFYGIMFADLGQGLALLLFGWILSYRSRKRNYKYLGKMAMTFGISASIFGFLTGSLFGLEIGHMYSISSLRIFQEGGTRLNLDTAISILSATIVLGTFHLSMAYVIAAINKIRSKEYVEAFAHHFSTLVMYSSAFLLGLSFLGTGGNYKDIFTTTYPLPILSTFLNIYVPSSAVAIITAPLLLGSTLVVILGRAIASLFSHTFIEVHGKQRLPTEQASMSKEFLSNTLQGLKDVAFKPIEFLANTISYSRLGIFLIMHSALMGLVNNSWWYGFSGIPLAIVGNIFVMGLEGFLVYIQDLRLHLYEWFTKIYSGADEEDVAPFTYMKPETQFVEIKFIPRRMELIQYAVSVSPANALHHVTD